MTNPRHKSCAVTIEDNIVITGGTMLGLGRVKPVWLAEIGTKTAESFDGTDWKRLPSLSRAKVTSKKSAEFLAATAALEVQMYVCLHMYLCTYALKCTSP